MDPSLSNEKDIPLKPIHNGEITAIKERMKVEDVYDSIGKFIMIFPGMRIYFMTNYNRA